MAGINIYIYISLEILEYFVKKARQNILSCSSLGDMGSHGGFEHAVPHDPCAHVFSSVLFCFALFYTDLIA